jgi:two-component system, OmpR family, alkaline phosphatase synthesis response regulator PhoP
MQHGIVASMENAKGLFAPAPRDSALASKSPVRARTILVIDDDVPTIELLSAALTLEGYRVIEATNGRDGLKLLASERPDLVLCDVLMPELDGRGVAEAMQSHSTFKHVPLVLVSAGQEARVARGIQCTAFIEKPFSVSALCSMVAELLAAV